MTATIISFQAKSTKRPLTIYENYKARILSLKDYEYQRAHKSVADWKNTLNLYSKELPNGRGFLVWRGCVAEDTKQEYPDAGSYTLLFEALDHAVYLRGNGWENEVRIESGMLQCPTCDTSLEKLIIRPYVGGPECHCREIYINRDGYVYPRYTIRRYCVKPFWLSDAEFTEFCESANVPAPTESFSPGE